MTEAYSENTRATAPANAGGDINEAPPSAGGRFSEARAGLIVFAVLALAAFLAYRRVLDNTLLGDDYGLIAIAGKQPVTQLWKLFSGLAPEFMRPVPLLVWWLQYKLFGTAGMPSHIINTSLHAGTGFLLYLLLTRLGAARLVALLAALLFVVSPAGPEAVSWSAGRFDILSLLFMMATLIFYAAYLNKPGRAVYAGAIAATALALLSKEQATMLIIVLPVFDVLYARHPRNEARFLGIDWKPAASQSARRLAPFLLVLLVFFALRYLVLGSFGGYAGLPKAGMPTWFAAKTSFNTLLSPLNNYMFIEDTIMNLLHYMYVLVVVSLVVVATGWRKATDAARRLWLFLLVTFFASIIPIFPYALMGGLPSNLKGSRFFYTPTAVILSLLVVGIVEFGFKARGWRIAAALPLALLLPVYLWAVDINNRPWEDAAVISYDIPEAVYSLLPDPPPDSKLYFENIPTWNGAYVYITGLPQAIRFRYGRDDLEVVRLDPAFDRPDDSYAYMFYYDGPTEQVRLVRGPLRLEEDS
ncbi:MAG: glycosyltransferase family 39 protein [Thermoleophilia bacterium]